jgi:hypothetical protein
VTNPNAEIVRKLFDAVWEEGDLDAARDLLHPEADFDWADSRAPYHGRFKGHTELSVRDGKVTGAKLFQSKAEALEAVGLTEER